MKLSRSGVTVFVFPTPKTIKGKTYSYFEIRYKEGGKTKRTTVSGDETTATEKAQRILDNLTLGVTATLTQADILDFQREKARLGDYSIHEAVSFFLRHHGQTISTAEAICQFLEAQENRELSQRTRAKYRGALTQFCKAKIQGNLMGAFNLGQVTVAMLDKYLANFQDPVTRISHRSILVNFWRWARAKGHLPPDTLTVAERTDCPQAPREDPVPFDVDTLEKIMRLLEQEAPELCWPVALGAFAGLRTSEIDRNPVVENGHIVLGSDQTKTRRRRIIEIPRNLLCWKVTQSPIPANWRKAVASICQDAGIPWVRNGLRKGYVSHAVAHYQSIAQVAIWSGHSESVLKTHYYGLKTKAEGKRWFSIFPS